MLQFSQFLLEKDLDSVAPWKQSTSKMFGDLVTHYHDHLKGEAQLKVGRGDSTVLSHPTIPHVKTIFSDDQFGYGQTHAFLDYRYPHKPIGMSNIPHMFAHAVAAAALHLEKNPDRKEVHFTGETKAHVKLYHRLHQAFNSGHFDQHPVLGKYNMDIYDHGDDDDYDDEDEDHSTIRSPTFVLHKKTK